MLAVVIFVATLAMQVGMAFVMHSSTGEHESKRFLAKFGDTLTHGLTLKGFFGTYWHLLVLLRWGITLVVLVAGSLALQLIFLLLVSVLVQVLVIRKRPFLHLEDTFAFMFSEVMVSCYVYSLISLTA
jgi:hypothetical protein